MQLNSITEPNEIRAYVEANGNVASMPMKILRDAFKKGRLGIHVRAQIARELAGLGLGIYPSGEELPDNQNEEVRIYKLGSTAAQIVQAVLKPGRDGDALIRRALSKESEEKLEKIRELIET